MNKPEAVNGSRVSVYADGRLLCGVTEAVCAEENTVEEIREFLTEKPVARFCSRKYVITLKLSLNSGNAFFAGTPPEVIVIEDKHGRASYEDCCVEKAECKIQPNAAAAYTVRLSAKKRSFENVG